MKNTIELIIVIIVVLAVVIIIMKKIKEINLEKKVPRILFPNIYEIYLKRVFDIVCSVLAIVCFGWLYAIVAVLVRFKLGSPVLFKQQRPGKDEIIFNMYKFRTMTNEKDKDGNFLPDEYRLTSFGKKLRATSLDELPEVFNILKGDMSIIGPRPQLVRDMVFMSNEHRQRHTVRPGLSGLAQVNGRNDIDWEEKLNLDLKYIKKITFIGDLKIIMKTITKAFIKQEGITDVNMATAEDYGDYLLNKCSISREVYNSKQLEAREILHQTKRKKVLIVASVISFIEWFNKENIDYLKKTLGCEVDIACNFKYMADTDVERTKNYISYLKSIGINLHNINFARNPLNRENIKCYVELRNIINSNDYTLVHCHTPAASVITRFATTAARKKRTVVMYTCHGFHFHNSSPKKNWIIYYPIEKYLSLFCDYIITINKEDYKRAKSFYCKNVRYIPGVGVNLKKIKTAQVDKKEMRKSISVPEDSILIISVGELIERKNHEAIIRAIAKIDNTNIYYAIAGKGPLKEQLEKLSKELGVSDRVKFLGFRTDINKLYHIADISAFPSKIEGLGLAGIEAMAAGLPLVSSNVHGILDYVINGKTGFSCNPDSIKEFELAIRTLVNNSKLRDSMKINCYKAVEPFELENALKAMWNIYDEILK